MVCISLVCSGFLVSCVDKNEEVDEDSKPEWLGNSIYEELKSPNQSILTGTFTNYLNLVDDLGYSTVLSKTGSKTVFPANDEAFARFFANNSWGVSRYADLTDAQKKMLLYSSMLDNSLLINMLSNVSSGSTDVKKGEALKHSTSLNVIDTIPFYLVPTTIFHNNSYWTKFDQSGIYVVSDNTKPMMVHFTREQMLAHDITTSGSGSDFDIITGSEYTEGSAYIYRNKIINSDVTCQNGYIQQVENVVVPPGNLAQVIRENSETSIFSRMLDRFSVPYFDQNTTNNYNDWAVQHNKTLHDSIFQIRYLSSISQGQSANNSDPNGTSVSSDLLLPFDPGWNQYYVQNKLQTNVDWTLADIGAMFVPDNDALKTYFLPGGSGEFLIDRYGSKSNTETNLLDNIDCIPQNIIQKFVSNLMKTSFVGTVPSKFSSMTNDVSDDMGMTLSYIKKDVDGTYDVKIANNGVVYVMNSVIAPTEYDAVSAPAYFGEGMSIVNWIIQNKSMTGTTANTYSIDLDFYAYLKAMTANYAVFLPDNHAFNYYYIDPASLGHIQPVAYHFYYNSSVASKLCVSQWAYNPTTKQVTDSLGEIKWNSSLNHEIVSYALTDIMNYHTVVLGSGEKLGINKYYKTKHGGEIMLTNSTTEGSYVMSGGQIENGLSGSKIETVYNQKNGVAYKIDHLIQGPQQSVYKVLKNNKNRFSEFIDLCTGFDNKDLLEWVGISSTADSETGIIPQDLYKIFVSNNGLDYNVKFFNTYNYTLYAPDNDAMMLAYNSYGLPGWEEINNLYETYYGRGNIDEENAKAKAYEMIKTIRSFVRYHFQTTSIYADTEVDGDNYQTLCADDMGLFESVSVSGGSGKLVVKDNAGISHTIDSSSSTFLSNIMARDFEFDAEASKATYVKTSSFAVIHEISTPLFYTTTKKFNSNWNSKTNLAKTIRKYKSLKASNNL